MSETNEKLINRVRKLLALSRNNPNENEASAAMEKVHELLAAHNIELAQIESDTPTQADQHEKRIKTPHDRSALYKYQQDLFRAIAETNMCMYFVQETRRESFGKMRNVKQHVLLGSKINMMVATMMYDYLVDTLDDLLPYQGMQKRGKDALMWLAGCSDRLQQRLRDRHAMELQEKRSPVVHGGNQIVLADVYSSEADLNHDALYGHAPGTTARRRKEEEARQAEYAARRKAEQEAILAKERELFEDGYSAEDAWYVARGLAVPSQTALAQATRVAPPEKPKPAPKPETEAQARRRREREEAQQRRENEAWWKAQQRNAKYSDPVYLAGKNAAEDIGLDRQVKGAEKRELLK